MVAMVAKLVPAKVHGRTRHGTRTWHIITVHGDEEKKSSISAAKLTASLCSVRFFQRRAMRGETTRLNNVTVKYLQVYSKSGILTEEQ